MFAEISEELKARITEADPNLAHSWDNLTIAERYDRVIVCDSLNGPKLKLFFGLGDICFWDGDASGKSIHGTLVAEIESWTTLVADRPSEKKLRDMELAQLEQSKKLCDAVRERLLAGVIPDADETGEIIDLLRQFVGETWCSKISFPIWLEKVEKTENRWSRRQFEDAFNDVREPGTPDSDESTALKAIPAAITETPESKEPIILKCDALVHEFSKIWRSIRLDLKDKKRHANGLLHKANVYHGHYDVEMALRWAREEGKIEKNKAEQFVATDQDGVFAATLKQLFRF